MSSIFVVSCCSDSGDFSDAWLFDNFETAYGFVSLRGGRLVHPEKKEGRGVAWITKVFPSMLPPVVLGSYRLDGAEVSTIGESAEILKPRYPVGRGVELPGVYGAHFPRAVIESVDEIVSTGGGCYLTVRVNLDPTAENEGYVIYRHDKIKVRPALPAD